MKKILLFTSYFVFLTILTSCYSRSIGETLLNKDKVVKEELKREKDKDYFKNKYINGFVGEYKIGNKKFYEFQYSKISYNWLGMIPIYGFFTKDIKIDKHIIIYFDDNNKITSYKTIGYK